LGSESGDFSQTWGREWTDFEGGTRPKLFLTLLSALTTNGKRFSGEEKIPRASLNVNSHGNRREEDLQNSRCH